MWLSERSQSQIAECGAEIGTVTLAGNPAGVYLAGERRNLPVLSPGGFAWAPQAGDQVLVIKTGAAGEAPYVVAVRQNDSVSPGSVRISNGAGTASVILDASGTLALNARTILINGQAL